MSRKPRSQTNRFASSRSRNWPMTLMPSASWLSTNSRSKRSIRTSRVPGWSVYCRSSTIGQQVRAVGLVIASPAVRAGPEDRIRYARPTHLRGTPDRTLLMKHTTAATTLPMSARAHFAQTGYLLAPAQVITSPETRLRYRVDRLLGEGGFGQAYLASRLWRSRMVTAIVFIKVSERIDGWLREAYFGQLLDGHPRAIRVYDTFPLMRSDGRVLYCLTLEYARQGDLRAFLHSTGRGWPESTARREIAGILQVLGKLHRGQMLHRDLTPMNVFVCEGRNLKLGDFGIVRHQSDRGGIAARTMNAMTAPTDILMGAVPK